MSFQKRDYWYATLRQVSLGHTRLILRENKTHGQPWFGPRLSLNLRVGIGKREVILATHRQHEVS